MMIHKRTQALAVACALLSGAGCGNLTAGGAGEVEVAVASDEGAVLESMAAGPSTTDVPVQPQFAPFTGSLTLTLAVSLLDEDGMPVDLTGGSQQVTLPLEPGSRTGLVTARVDPGSYTGVQVTFESVEAEITSSPGESTFPPFVEVDLSEGPLVVERPRPIEVGTDERVRLVVDLRSRIWILAADPSDGRVARGVLQNAVRVEVEPAG
jgi:hypothetical protein